MNIFINKKNYKKTIYLIPLVVNLVSICSYAGEQFKMNINVSGTVIASGSCTFSPSNEKHIDFGDVKFSTINNKNKLTGDYKRKLGSAMTCTGDTSGGAQMQLITASSDELDFQGEKLLKVKDESGNELPSLGIRLVSQGGTQNINTWFDINTADPQHLEVELVQTDNGDDYKNGETFTASATLMMAFN